MLLTWSERYKVGLEIIDQQHEQLFRLLSRLEQSLTVQNAPQQQDRGIESFIVAVQQHFETEEKLLKETSYPGYQKQRADPGKLLKQLEMDAAKVKDGRLVLSLSLLQSWQEPLLRHIMGADMAYSEFLKDQGVK